MKCVVRLLLVIAVVAVVVSAVGDAARPRSALVHVQADREAGTLHACWDEINLWKLYSWFGVHRSDPADDLGDGWLRRLAPWLRYARVVAPLGGSYGPQIAKDCDHARVTAEHPSVGWECGIDGKPGVAARNEILQWNGSGWTTDYTPFRVALQRLLRSGLKPHINLSATPVAFTGGRGDFRHYHWNARPPEDVDAWIAFVEGGFEAVSDLGLEGWRVSIINEPNCLIPDANGDIQHVGYAGNPEAYARTWTRAAERLHRIAPGLVLHPGNYVTSATFPGEDNLDLYLAAMAKTLSASKDLSWNGFPWIGLSLYEVPDTTLSDFRSTRIRRLYRAQERNGLQPRPIKIDEMGIHHDVRQPFEERTMTNIDSTLYSGSWFAEALRSFVAAGDVASSAPWLHPLFDERDWTPRPAAYVYRMLGMLAGQLDVASAPDQPLRVVESGNDDGLTRLPVEIVAPDRLLPSSLEALATRDHHVVRVFVVHHQPTPVTDDDPIHERLAVETNLEISGLRSAAYRMRHVSLGGRPGARWEGGALSPLEWQSDGCWEAADGTVALRAPHHMSANSVWLFELTRVPRCSIA